MLGWSLHGGKALVSYGTK